MSETAENPLVEALEHYNRGVEAMSAGDLRLAVMSWRQAVETEGALVCARRNLAVAYEELERFEDALEQWTEVLALEPWHTEALVRQASALAAAGRRAEAIANYERALGIYPYFRFWYQELADLLDEDGRPEDALRWRQRGQRIDADEADMALEDAQGALRRGDLGLAVTILDAVLEELPGNLEARFSLAQAHSARADHAASLSQLDAALEQADATRPLVFLHRAAARLRAGDGAGAEADLREALDLEPRYGRAATLLESLRALRGETEAEAPSTPPASSQTGKQPKVTGQVATRDGQWVQGLRPLLAEVGQGRGRDGKPGRLAVLYQPAVQLVPAVEGFFGLLEERALGFVGGGERIWLCEAALRPSPGANVAQEGWLGGERTPELRLHAWGEPPSVTQLEPLLMAAEDAGGAVGFHTLIVLAAGPVRADGPHLSSLLRRIASERVVVLPLGDAAGALTSVLDASAPGWRSFALES